MLPKTIVLTNSIDTNLIGICLVEEVSQLICQSSQVIYLGLNTNYPPTGRYCSGKNIRCTKEIPSRWKQGDDCDRADERGWILHFLLCYNW